MAMTPEEKFILDLQGYLVIKNVLTDAELAELNEVAGSKFPTPAQTAAGAMTSSAPGARR